MDGSRTPRSEMVSKIAKWVSAPEQEKLWQSRPIKGEVGIIYVPETQFFTYAQQGSTSYYSQSMQGVYQGFFDHNIQADWVHINHIDEYDFLYLPFPVMLAQETADKLRAWVDAGGTLISEGCTGYWGDRGHVGTVQPNLGLDELFGVRESYVEFTPDLLGNLKFNLSGIPVWGGLFLQAYQPTTGTTVGWYDDGRIAVVDNAFGKGRTRLIGTMPGVGYAVHPKDRSPAFFADLLEFAGKQQHVKCSDTRVKARLHDGAGGTYLWVANPTRQTLLVHLELGEAWGPFASEHSLWGAEETVNGRTIILIAEARDVAVIALFSS
jgi:beta-galactosidase